MSTPYSTEAMQRRFWELTKQKEVFKEEIAPLREQYDLLAAKMGPLQAQKKKIGTAIKDAERPVMPAIDGELATLARALGNKVGPRPDDL